MVPAGSPALGLTGPVTDGSLSYAGADIGYSWINGGKNAPTFGPFAGYMYWNDSPNVGRANFTVGTQDSDFSNASGFITGPMDSKEDNVVVNALRLGFSGKMNFGSAFDLSGELAAVPYAKVNGTLGGFGVVLPYDGGTHRARPYQSSAAD